MFACFVFALLGFLVKEFPEKSEKNPGHLSLTKGHMSGNLNLTHISIIYFPKAVDIQGGGGSSADHHLLLWV